MRHTRIAVMAVVTTVAVLMVAFTGTTLAGRHGMWNGTGEEITTRQAREVASEYLVDRGFSELTIAEVMEFSNHFYAVVTDPATGDGAFELIVSRDGRAAHPEPTMMWNTGYNLMNPGGATSSLHNMQGMMHQGPGQGMMGGGHSAGMMQDMMSHGMMGDAEHRGMMHGDMNPGMMSGGMAGQHSMDPGQCPAMLGVGSSELPKLETPLTSGESLAAAQEWLDTNQPDSVATDLVAFPGYVTLHIETDGEVTGMLSVNAATGAVWEHTWHGELISIDHGN